MRFTLFILCFLFLVETSADHVHQLRGTSTQANEKTRNHGTQDGKGIFDQEVTRKKSTRTVNENNSESEDNEGKSPTHSPTVSQPELDNNCHLVKFRKSFAIFGPTWFLAYGTSPSSPGFPEYYGTVFGFETDPLLEKFDANSDTQPREIPGTAVSGTCTRITVGADSGGSCDYIIQYEDGSTINVHGFLQGPLGSRLAVTGGTGKIISETENVTSTCYREETTLPYILYRMKPCTVTLKFKNPVAK